MGGEVGAAGVSSGEVEAMGVDNISQRAATVGVGDGQIAEPGERVAVSGRRPSRGFSGASSNDSRASASK
jgi:hypothetical protein